MLATRYGSAAIDLVHEGKFGRLVVLRGTEITHIPLEDAIAKTRTIGDDLISLAAGLHRNLTFIWNMLVELRREESGNIREI